jgi:cytochrome o ubiquinol oxidase subunit IV
MDFHIHHRLHDRSTLMATPQTHTTAKFINYTLGFVLSVGLTLIAYSIVTKHQTSGHLAYSHHDITIAVMVLAVLQLAVQVLFFLHLGSEARPKWNVTAFLFMLLTVLIIGIGSLWIMDNLNYHMMSEQDMNQHLHEESQKGF